MRKLTKFFITCAAVFVAGLIMTIAGIATGGVEGFDKVAEDHDWVSAGPGELTTVAAEGEFERIEATGYIDVVIVGQDYYDDVMRDYDFVDVQNPEPGMVAVAFGDAIPTPEVDFEEGTLKLQGLTEDSMPVGLDFSSVNAWPTAIVFCDDRELESITISAQVGDIDMMGVAFENADIGINSGDVDLHNVSSKGIKIHLDAGDAEISGDIRGTTEITADAGDIEIDTRASVGTYTMEISTEGGDITIDENEEGDSYKQNGGKDTLILKTTYGDVEIEHMMD